MYFFSRVRELTVCATRARMPRKNNRIKREEKFAEIIQENIYHNF